MLCKAQYIWAWSVGVLQNLQNWPRALTLHSAAVFSVDRVDGGKGQCTVVIMCIHYKTKQKKRKLEKVEIADFSLTNEQQTWFDFFI